MARGIAKAVGVCFLAGVVAAQTPLGPSEYTVPGVFPTSVYESYYNDPTATTAEPQPVITDPITHVTYPYWLTNPETIPQEDTWETHPLPPTASSSQLLDYAVQQIISISTSPIFSSDTCAACQASLEVAKFLALAAPAEGPNLAIRLCEYFDYADDCAADYGIFTLGATLTQVAAYADAGGYDGQSICNQFLGLCPDPPTSPLDLTTWFAKPKPNPLPPSRKATGQRLKVLHMSDLHIDPRYTVGAEADCSAYLCCRPSSYNDHSPNVTVEPAPYYGAYYCDAPFPLILAAMQSVPVLTGTEEYGFNFSIYTGDLVSHDPGNQLSKEYTVYSEVRYRAQNSPYNIGPELTDQFNWDYDHLAALWEYEGWISSETAQQARTHYSAYSVQRHDGLRIITLNTDMSRRDNYYAYINLSSSDNSGMLRFVTDELQDAEDAGDRGERTDTPLIRSVDRFSPHVIAGVFFGHTHEDQLSVRRWKHTSLYTPAYL
ncbi:hypothetical protein IEO21_05357 [Rhodonia placenta]|uniref:Sphingomyelin phosphodiesterase n=1 Tax=Rhodonia placenta TaxID=104341 RepID=A0A8H7P2B1_9APHY|nr:hypothetical protein IEO21_05357 [Postia placenta]